MEIITVDSVKDYFKNQSQIAKQLNISRQAVSKWFINGNIPKLRQFEIQEILKGRKAHSDIQGRVS